MRRSRQPPALPFAEPRGDSLLLDVVDAQFPSAAAQLRVSSAIMLRESFPNSKFWPPATETQIASVEATLGVRLPEQLRSLFFECDGFRERRTNAKYLLSLTDYDFVGSLLSTTQFFWTEWKQYYPKLNLRPFVFFGSSGYVSWGINVGEPDQIIAYHHHMEGEYETAGSSILEVYRREYASQDDPNQKS